MTTDQFLKIERENEFVIEAPVEGADRAKRMVLEFLIFGIDEQMIIHAGSVGGKPAIVVEFADQKHIFYTFEARMLADSLEKTMHKFPQFSGNASIANLIMGIRLAADGSEVMECQVTSTS